MKVTSGNRQAVAFNSFLEASILLGIFEKMPNKIDASKEKYQTYLLPSIRAKNLSLTAYGYKCLKNFNKFVIINCSNVLRVYSI